MVLARTDPLNERNFKTGAQLGLKSDYLQRHSFTAMRMRNKYRQSHNFWSPESSIQIMHNATFGFSSNADLRSGF